MIRQRKLGSAGLAVSALGFGCTGPGGAYGAADDSAAIAAIHRAIELGVTLFDATEQCGVFEHEKLLGRALQGRREQVILATQSAFRRTQGQPIDIDSHPASIRLAVERSLRRLGTDYIDLLYLHSGSALAPIEDMVGTTADLVREGKVRFLGLSEAGAGAIRKAHAIHPVSAVQGEYSLWERNLDTDILPVLRELGIGLAAGSPLGPGYMTGAAKRASDYPAADCRHPQPKAQAVNLDVHVQLARVLGDIADARNLRPGQIALAWTLHKGDDIVPIPGARRRSSLEHNLAALAITLDARELEQLERSLKNVAGRRCRLVPDEMATACRAG
ncbi:aldo/keto reductase [Janthinobacterium sp. Mn2066]|uniref:aldo/keto reductase n=1 Tax=Janthinobacterium sp. Mn2066 TaxID=3395264 RepID=UPI003BC84309